ncbi:hypothetical protein D6829_02250 [Candidatus Pacearchaeota archaeon]|nr:MAG: hypothetical protein D6829_02250 [Candidatus Pacearchaeota archaeon]
MKKRYILTVLVLAVIFLTVVIVFSFSMHGNEAGTSLPEGLDKKFPDSQDFKPEELGEGSKDQMGFGKGFDAGGGSGEGSFKNSADECQKEQIAYSIGEFEHSQNCLSYTGQTCVKKELFCSARVSNLDNNISGNFELEFKEYYVEGGRETYFNSKFKQGFVGAKSSKNFNITDVVEGEVANKSFLCRTFKQSVPLRNKCN